jgi:hypothetical protein
MASTSGRAVTVGKAVLVLIVLFGAIQLVPYGKDHRNPPVQKEPPWDSPQTRAFFFRACKNCHSNETVWPWYGSVAPFSWLVQYDVDHARRLFNVSEWGRKENRGDRAAGEVREGDMPPLYYRPLHPESWFTKAERQEYIDGLVRTFGDREARRPVGKK